MFTFSYLYVILYLLIILSLFIFCFKHIPVKLITHQSLTNLSTFLYKYVPSKNLFFFPIFALTGLPPVGLFFLKFNILIYVLYQTHIFLIVLIFFMFFFNMVYYIQIFNFRNTKKNLYPILSPAFMSNWLSTKSFFMYQTTYNTYKLSLAIVNTLLLLFLTPLFFCDYFLIIAILF